MTCAVMIITVYAHNYCHNEPIRCHTYVLIDFFQHVRKNWVGMVPSLQHYYRYRFQTTDLFSANIDDAVIIPVEYFVI